MSGPQKARSAPGALELLVFDWDGTLADSQVRIVRSIAHACDSLGLVAPPPERMRSVIGLGLVEAMAELFAGCPPGDTPDPELLAERYRAHFLSRETEPVSLFDGARETVHALSEAGYRLAVATGKGRRGLDRDLEQSALAHYFEATRCADEAFSKPHPQMLHDLLELTTVQAGKALMIGDTDFDMLMASNAGVHALAVTCGVHGAERLRAASPLALLADVACLPGWLGRTD
ncbi:MAG: HAD-IA family hydrolase [Gammaproteobacteria bacterium]